MASVENEIIEALEEHTESLKHSKVKSKIADLAFELLVDIDWHKHPGGWRRKAEKFLELYRATYGLHEIDYLRSFHAVPIDQAESRKRLYKVIERNHDISLGDLLKKLGMDLIDYNDYLNPDNDNKFREEGIKRCVEANPSFLCEDLAKCLKTDIETVRKIREESYVCQ